MKFIGALIGFVAVATAAAVSEPEDPFTKLVNASDDPLEKRQLANLCPALGNPFCCGTDVLGVADLQCTSPSPAPKNLKAFVKQCSQSGKTAVCCTLPVGQIGLLCSTVTPN